MTTPNWSRRIALGRRADFRWAIVAAVAAAAALTAIAVFGDIHAHNATKQVLTALGTAVFLVVALVAVRSASTQVHRLLAPLVGLAHASLVRIAITLAGVVLSVVAAMGLLGVPVQHLLVGGALTGVIIGIAAQQSLSNMFAGVVLLVARPFHLGQTISVTSGALGGEHRGKVVAVGFTYVLLDCSGTHVRLPNSGVLAAAVATDPADDDERPRGDHDGAVTGGAPPG
jgi:small conductance mechanosensitive channel